MCGHGSSGLRKQEAETAADGNGAASAPPSGRRGRRTEGRAAEAPGTPAGGSPASVPTSECCRSRTRVKGARRARPSWRHFIRTGDAPTAPGPRLPANAEAHAGPRGLVVLLSELESAVTARPGFGFFVLKKFKRPHISISDLRREHRRQTARGCAEPDALPARRGRGAPPAPGTGSPPGTPAPSEGLGGPHEDRKGQHSSHSRPRLPAPRRAGHPAEHRLGGTRVGGDPTPPSPCTTCT